MKRKTVKRLEDTSSILSLLGMTSVAISAELPKVTTLEVVEPVYFDNEVESTYFEFVTCRPTSSPVIEGQKVKNLLEAIREADRKRVSNWKPLFPLEEKE